MAICPSTRSGPLMVDEVLGGAFKIVKHVDDHLDDISAVAAITADVTRVSNDLEGAEGAILQGTLAVVLAGVANFRSTFAEALSAFPVGAYFTSAASGSLRLYKRTTGSPGYTDQGDVVAPVSRSFLGSPVAASNIGTEGDDLQTELDERPTSSFLSSNTGADRIGTSSGNTVQQELVARPTSAALLLAGGAATVGQAVIPEAVSVADALAALVPAFVPEANLLNATNVINTGVKFAGRQVISLPSGIQFYAQGQHPSSVWTSVDGEITLLPEG